MKITSSLLMFSTILAASGPAQAATTTVTLPAALTRAIPLDQAVKTAQANLAQAQTTNQATLADPSTLVVARLTASNGVSAAQANLNDARLSALQGTVTAYNTLLEAQTNTDLQTFQVQVNQKALDVAKVKLSTGNATSLDVQNAQNTLSGGQQNLAAAQAQLNLASAKLATILNVTGEVRAASTTTPPKLSVSLSSLQGGVARTGPLVTANNALTLAQLNVKLADNDYTPAQTLQQAQTALANAQRTLTTAQQNSTQGLASAYQTAQNTATLLEVAQSKQQAAQKQYDQDTQRLKSGTIAATDLLTSALALRQSEYALLQAQDNVLSSLAALSVAAGQNLTGLGGIN